MKVVMLYDKLMNFAAMRAFSALSVFIVHLSDVPETTGYFHANNGTVTKRVNPVINIIFLFLMVHNNHLFAVTKSNIAFVSLTGNPNRRFL